MTHSFTYKLYAFSSLNRAQSYTQATNKKIKRLDVPFTEEALILRVHQVDKHVAVKLGTVI